MVDVKLEQFVLTQYNHLYTVLVYFTADMFSKAKNLEVSLIKMCKVLKWETAYSGTVWRQPGVAPTG